MIKKTIKAALPYTLPVLAGYIFLGIAFGFLMVSKNFPIYYPILMSIIIYSGALEFAAIPLLSSAFNPIETLFMGLMLSARHLFYGIPMLDKYKDTGKWKLPLIFTLTDETFSISSTVEIPNGIDKNVFFISISLINYFYWISGTTIGAIFGKYITFNSTGIDFALTALFIVLFLEQIKSREGMLGGFFGLFITGIVLFLFGKNKMIIISMIIILIGLFLAKKRIYHE